LARDPADLERHINGSRFQRALTIENERSRASELVESMEMEFESPKEEENETDQSELVDERPIEEPAKKSEQIEGNFGHKTLTYEIDFMKLQMAIRRRSAKGLRIRRERPHQPRDQRSKLSYAYSIFTLHAKCIYSDLFVARQSPCGRLVS